MVPLLLVDGHNLLYRAAYGTPAEIYSRGTPRRDITTQFMFFALLRKAVTANLEDWPEIIVVFDGEHGTASRLAVDAAYKANRDASDAARRPLEALADITAGLDLYDIAWLEQDDTEADDAIATLTASRGGRQTIILSTDQDFYQLLAWPDPTRGAVCILNTARHTGQRILDPAHVHDRYGVSPARYPDLRALAGDPSDNIPGVTGVGLTTARRLLTDDLGLEDLPASGRLTGARGTAIRDGWTQVLTWRSMIRMRGDVPLTLNPTGQPTAPLPRAADIIDKLGLWDRPRESTVAGQ
jgi:DNA polymerase-1